MKGLGRPVATMHEPASQHAVARPPVRIPLMGLVYTGAIILVGSGPQCKGVARGAHQIPVNRSCNAHLHIQGTGYPNQSGYTGFVQVVNRR